MYIFTRLAARKKDHLSAPLPSSNTDKAMPDSLPTSEEFRALRFPEGLRQNDLASICADFLRAAIDREPIDALIAKFDSSISTHDSVLPETIGFVASTSIGIINEWIPERMRRPCKASVQATYRTEVEGLDIADDAIGNFECYGMNRFDFEFSLTSFLCQLGWNFEPVEKTQQALKDYQKDMVRNFFRMIDAFGSDNWDKQKTWHAPLDEATDDLIDAMINICDTTIARDGKPPEWHAERIAFAATYLSAKASLDAFPHPVNWATFRAAVENRMEGILPSKFDRSMPRSPEHARVFVSYGSPYGKVLDALEALCDGYLGSDGKITEQLGNELLGEIIGDHPNLPELINHFDIVVEFCGENIVPRIRRI